jgi:hypothetical protein
MRHEPRASSLHAYRVCLTLEKSVSRYMMTCISTLLAAEAYTELQHTSPARVNGGKREAAYSYGSLQVVL